MLCRCTLQNYSRWRQFLVCYERDCTVMYLSLQTTRTANRIFCAVHNHGTHTCIWHIVQGMGHNLCMEPRYMPGIQGFFMFLPILHQFGGVIFFFRCEIFFLDALNIKKSAKI